MSKQHMSYLRRYRYPRPKPRLIWSGRAEGKAVRPNRVMWLLQVSALFLLGLMLQVNVPDFILFPFVGAVTYVNGGPSDTAAPTTSWTIDTGGAGILADDILFVVNTNRGSTADPGITDNSGLGTAYARLDATASNGTAWWKRFPSSHTGPIVTSATNTDSCTGCVVIIRGAETSGNPFTNFSRQANASGTETHTGFTPSFADSMIILAVANTAAANSISSPSTTNPGALTTVLHNDTSTGGSDCACAIAMRVQAAGPTATGNVTWAQTNGTTVSMVWAVQPPQGAAAGHPAMRRSGGVQHMTPGPQAEWRRW